MPLLNRNNHPPGGGYSFYQPETKWFLKPGLPFDMAVQEIIRHRQANPQFNLATDYATVSDELDEYTCRRLNYDPKWCSGEKKKTAIRRPLSPLYPSVPVAQPAAPAATIVKRAQQVAGGIETLAGWLGSGAETVTPQVANNRAIICLGCPKNVRGNWVESVIGVVADAIRGTLALKKHLSLATQVDDGLGTCDACGCNLPLKVWVSPGVIRESLTEDIVRELTPQCWMKRL